MTKDERKKAIECLKWFEEYNEEDYCGGDRIQDEHGDWYYRITKRDFAIFDMIIDLLGQEPCDDAISRQTAIRNVAQIAKTVAKSDKQKSLCGRIIFMLEHMSEVSK